MNVVYTVLTGNNYKLREPTFKNEGWDYVCFTNNDKLKSKGWKIIKIEDSKYDNRKLSRKIKILPHLYLNNYTYSLYLDTRFVINQDLSGFLSKYLIGKNILYDIALMKHHKRNCVYKEAKKCIEDKKDNPKIINKQIERYRKEKFPENAGLYAPGIMLRNHNEERVKNLMEDWFKEIEKGSYRDIISFPYVLKNNPEIKINLMNFRKIYSSFK